MLQRQKSLRQHHQTSTTQPWYGEPYINVADDIAEKFLEEVVPTLRVLENEREELYERIDEVLEVRYGSIVEPSARSEDEELAEDMAEIEREVSLSERNAEIFVKNFGQLKIDFRKLGYFFLFLDKEHAGDSWKIVVDAFIKVVHSSPSESDKRWAKYILKVIHSQLLDKPGYQKELLNKLTEALEE